MEEKNENKGNNEKKNDESLIGTKLFNKYLIIKKLGEGSFGSIYSAKENNDWYAIKFENKNKGQNLLENEAYIMSYLSGFRIPFVQSFGYSGNYNVLVMELMGKSLEDLFENLPSKKMSIRCVCNIGYQMIEILEYIHNKHIIHRDIKPDNFIMGRGNKNKYLYLLDFGLAKKYRSSTTLKHYPLIQKKKLTGTARYASRNALDGITQSRRDDLESVGYVLMYFLRGRLPWQGITNNNKTERYAKILEIKKITSPEKLCFGYPKEFEEYVRYTRDLLYEQDPDYSYLKNLFVKVLKKEGYVIDYYYDWDTDTITIATNDTSNFNNCKNKNNNADNEELRISVIKESNDIYKENDSNINKSKDEKNEVGLKKVEQEDMNKNEDKNIVKNEERKLKNENTISDNKNKAIENIKNDNDYFEKGIINGQRKKNKKRSNEDTKCCCIF